MDSLSLSSAYLKQASNILILSKSDEICFLKRRMGKYFVTVGGNLPYSRKLLKKSQNIQLLPLAKANAYSLVAITCFTPKTVVKIPNTNNPQ